MKDLRKMEWLYHAQLDPNNTAFYSMEEQLSFAWRALENCHPDTIGCKVVLALIKEEKDA